MAQISNINRKLAERGIVDINQETEASLAYTVRESLVIAQSNGIEELQVQITSNGGRVDVGLDVYDMIRLYPAKRRIGTVFGYARSMGAVILQACDVRRCSRHGSILIHYVSTSNVPLDVLKDKRKLGKVIARGEYDQRALDRIF
jgi:ATP-dependent protease ClpP protease subunit